MSTAPVTLVLTDSRSRYSIEEPIRPQLRMVNDTLDTVEIPGFVFDWQELAFASPNSVFLIAPDGTDLAMPYRDDDAGSSRIPVLRVEPGRDEWLYLPIYAHFRLRQVGAYRFGLQLVDDQGQVHRTNELRYELIDVTSTVPPDSVELSLEPTQQTSSGDPIRVTATFTNRGVSTLTFLLPQQDSFDGWVNPVYRFVVTDAVGRVLPHALRSGSMAEPRYGPDAELHVQAGSTARLALELPPIPRLREPGEYEIRLTYLVRDRAIGKAGAVLDEPMQWDPGVFVGRLESNAVRLTVR